MSPLRYTGSNLGLKFGLERQIRVLSPRFSHTKIRKQTNNYKFIPHFVRKEFVPISYGNTFKIFKE